MMVKCRCGTPDCTGKLTLDTASSFLTLAHDGDMSRLGEVSIYLDANAAVELIHMFRAFLVALANEPTAAEKIA